MSQVPRDSPLGKTVIAFLRNRASETRLGDGLCPTEPPIFDVRRITSTGAEVPDSAEATHVSVFITWTTAGVGHQIQEVLDIDELREFYKDNAESKPKDSPPPAPPPTVQRNWFTDRTRILGIRKPRVVGPRGGGNSWDARGSLRDQGGRVICVCSQQMNDKTKPCDHVMYAYLTGMDNQVLNLSSVRATGRELKVMIGLGTYIMNLRVARAVDEEDPSRKVKFLLVASEVEIRLRSALAMKSDDRYIMTDDEGMLGYVSYIEDLCRETDIFKKLSMATLGADITTIRSAGGCSRHHNSTVSKLVMSAMSASNPMREAWMIGNVASMHDVGSQCLGCRQLAVGSADVPDLSDHPV